MKILGIETSCDETAAALIETKQDGQTVRLISQEIASSITLHRKTGGIIPETASREQIKYILPIINQVLQKSTIYPQSSKTDLPSSIIHSPNIDAIAVTFGPGLVGSLLVGVETAKTLAYIWNKPIIPVNHLVGHIYANWLDWNYESGIMKYEKKITIEFPALALVVSGGHTDLVIMKDHGEFKVLGATRDDAAGEAFDKIGRLLGLPYPAGPTIENLAKKGNSKAFNFPRPMFDSGDFDFSFSGLKTAVLQEVKNDKLVKNVILDGSGEAGEPIESRSKKDPIASLQDDKVIADLCASVQQAVVDVLVAKTIKAAKQNKVKSILLGGGVAANDTLRKEFELTTKAYGLNTKIFAPQKSLCTDNAAMIATAAAFNYKPVPWRKITADPELYFS